MVTRGVRGEERKCSDNTARVAEPDHPRRADTALRMAVQVHEIPTDDDWASGESAHGDQTDSRVLCGKGLVHGHEDGKTDNCERCAKCDERGAEVRGVREIGGYET